MNVSDSECSSGCESGWTLYLEQSFHSMKPSGFCEDKEKVLLMEDEEEEEDLSMVSDASSGPPVHFHEEFEDEEEAMLHFNAQKPCFFNAQNTSLKFGKRQHVKQQQRFSSHDDQDDTASSTLLSSSNMEELFGLTNNNNNTNNQGSEVESVLNYSQGFSATHFQRRRPALQDPFGLVQSSSVSRNNPRELNDMKGIRRWK